MQLPSARPSSRMRRSAATCTLRLLSSTTVPGQTAAMVLAVSGIARAHDDDDDTNACNNFTLHGLYVFTASGFNIISGVPQPKAIMELIDFHTGGNLTVPAATVSINGVISRSAPGGTG